MKKVLVTGADGFIGSHLTESLLEKGYEVKAFAYYNSFNTWGWLDTLPPEKLKEIEVFTGDIRDPNGVREAMEGMDAVFHLAALIAIPFSYHSPDSYVDTNIKGTLNVLQAARQLEQAGVEYNVLTVVTGYLARHIQSVFSSLCREGFRFQQYIPCLDPLEEERGGQEYSLSPAQYEEFLKKLFDLWYRELEQGRYWSIRYFDNLLWMLEGHAPEQCSMRGYCGLQYLVEADGSVYPCDFYGLDAYRLGNIRNDAWDNLDRAREALGFVEASRRIPEKCGHCRWYPLCRNGCRRDRVLEGEQLGCSYYCEAYAGFFAYALPRLGRARLLLRRIQAP